MPLRNCGRTLHLGLLELELVSLKNARKSSFTYVSLEKSKSQTNKNKSKTSSDVFTDETDQEPNHLSTTGESK